MMKRPLDNFRKDQSGVAAAEMALVVPLLLVLMFGALEMGNLFYTQHVMSMAVRDGARYAARLPFDSNSCAHAATEAPPVEDIVRAALPNGSGTATVAVLFDCANPDEYSGIYDEMDGQAPDVEVSVEMGYRSLVGAIGLINTNLTLRARSKAAVTGA